MIEIKSHFSDWKQVSKETAIKFIKHVKDNATNIPSNKIIEYIEQNKLRGIKVLNLCPDFLKPKSIRQLNEIQIDNTQSKEIKEDEKILLEEMTEEDRKVLNQYVRESNKLNLLKSIRRDMLICELEGWDKKNI